MTPPSALAPSLPLEEDLEPLDKDLARMTLLPGQDVQQALESPGDEEATVSTFLQPLSLKHGRNFLAPKLF